MNVIMPVAGLGSRFATEGYTKPKPLIKIKGKEMVKWAAESIPFVSGEDFTFVVRQAHVDNHDLDEKLHEFFSPAATVIVIDYLTKGPACTAALAAEAIDDDEPVIITDSDQYFQSQAFYDVIQNGPSDVAGAIPVFTSQSEGNSYSALDDERNITRVAEKERISEYANIGAYYFREFGDFRWALERIQNKAATVNSEYYVAPTYNELIDRGQRVVARECDKVWKLGTPEDVAKFQREF